MPAFFGFAKLREGPVSPVKREHVSMTAAADFLVYTHPSVSRPESLLVLAAVGTLAGVYWFYKGFRLLQRKRLILNTPESKIRSASMGLVEISGLAAGPYVVTSPLSQTGCYYYKSLAWQLKQEGKNREWVKVAEENLHVPFYVDDNTDKVLVDARGAEMDLHCDFKEEYHGTVLFSGPEMRGCVAEFLTRHGVDSDKRIKVEEYCIKPKNFLFVLGTLSQNPGLDATVMPSWAARADQRLATPAQCDAEVTQNFRGNVQEVIRLPGESSAVPVAQMTQQQKIAAALMKAGINNPAAWATAGVGVKVQPAAVSTKTQMQTANSSKSAAPVSQPGRFSEIEVFDLHPPVVLMKGSHNPSFFISWRSQRDVVKSLGWKSGLMIWGGPALALASIYFLFAHFRWL
jgi:hypothetical protein